MLVVPKNFIVMSFGKSGCKRLASVKLRSYLKAKVGLEAEIPAARNAWELEYRVRESLLPAFKPIFSSACVSPVKPQSISFHTENQKHFSFSSNAAELIERFRS